MANIDGLIDILKKHNHNKKDLELIRDVYAFAEMAHGGQKRKTGEPYISHPLATAITLAKMRLDIPAIAAGLLHDVPEDTSYNLIDIEKKFGKEIAQLVMGITKLSRIKYRGIEKYAENLRKMFVSMAEDVRVILIKMADRLNNMETLHVHLPYKQKRIAMEVLDIYAPIALRLGMGQIKGDLEDLAFPYAYPKEFKWFERNIMPEFKKRMEHIDNIKNELEKIISIAKVKIISLHGRKKHYYSLYQKLLRPQYDKDITKIFDLVAIRIVVPTVSDCYKVLGIIHSQWKPLPGRIKDYIAQPKPNNYQSLHTTVVAPGGKIVEFQIRTSKMHDQAEYGIAAYWHYKDGGMKIFSRITGFHPRGYNPPKKLKWIQDLAEWQKRMFDNTQYINALKTDALKDRIFVFTPQGDVIELPEESTAIDFAYHVHTDIGHKCTAVKINGLMESLDTQLKNGDMIEIITNRNRKSPNRDWLNFVKTNTAKNKIRSFFQKRT